MDVQRIENQYPGLGMVLGAVSGCLYATLYLFIQLLRGKVGVVMVLWWRLAVSLATFLPYWAIKRPYLIGSTRSEDVLLLFIAFLGIFGSYLLFASTHLIPLGNITTIISSSPIFVTTINVCLTKTCCSFLDVFTIVMSLTGVVLCVQPDFIFHNAELYAHDWAYFKGCIYALIIALVWALVFHTFRHLQNVNSSAKIFWINIVPLIPVTIFLISMDELTFGYEWMDFSYLITGCMCGVLSMVLITYATKIDNPLMVSIGRNMEIPTGFLFDVLLFGLPLNIIAIIGAIFVVLSILVPACCKLTGASAAPLNRCCSRLATPEV